MIRSGLLFFALQGCVTVVEDDPTFTDTDFGFLDTDEEGPGFVVVPAEDDTWPWKLPANFPRPVVPAANPMTAEKVALGRWLFYDVRLSFNEAKSCASCHDQARGFADPHRLSVGATGEATKRNAPGLQNVAFYATMNWANPSLLLLEDQHRGPLFGTDPIELGATGHEAAILASLRAEPRYPALFAAAFPDDADPFTFDRVVDALAAFMRSLVSADAPVDRLVYGEQEDALTAQQKQGMDLFFSERLECHHCHGGFHFSRSVVWRGASRPSVAFDQVGLYNLDGIGLYPERDRGLADVTGEPSDNGRFRPPSLRNVVETAPYMHDGSINTLDEVLGHYAGGGREISEGELAGDGRLNPYKSSFVHGFDLSASERAAVIAFLGALSDRSFLSDPTHADPFADASPGSDP